MGLIDATTRLSPNHHHLHFHFRYEPILHSSGPIQHCQPWAGGSSFHQVTLPSSKNKNLGKLINSLKHLVKILCSPPISTVFGEGIGLVVRLRSIRRYTLLLIVIPQPFPTAKAFFKLALPSDSPYVSHSPIPSAYLRDIRAPPAVNDVSSSYDALVDLFISIDKFLGGLRIYTEVPLTQTLKPVLVKIIVELLSTLV